MILFRDYHKLNKINISIYYLSIYRHAIYTNEFEFIQEISQTMKYLESNFNFKYISHQLTKISI